MRPPRRPVARRLGGSGRGHGRRRHRSIEHVAGVDDFEVAEATYRQWCAGQVQACPA